MGLNYHREKPPSRITVPENAPPLAKLVFAEMRHRAFTMEDLEWRAGVLIDTFKGWRKGVQPGLAAIQAALGALGWELVPVRITPLPAEIVEGLEHLRAQWAAEQPQLFQLLAASCLAPVIPQAG